MLSGQWTGSAIPNPYAFGKEHLHTSKQEAHKYLASGKHKLIKLLNGMNSMKAVDIFWQMF